METRVPAPDGKKGRDDLPVLVLPEGTLLKEAYRVSYYTVGGMSVVYRGERDGKIYLLKEVSAADSQRVISLTQEKSMLERFEHPGIVQILDFFEQNGYYYMVLEFIHGKSLDRLISRTPGVFLDEDLVSDWAFQLYDIFEYLHGQSPPVIYRDLKPQNVILDTRGRLKLVDFGIARVYKGDRVEDTFSMGSAITASPEHYGMKKTDGRYDIFTLGATLHYILTNGLGPVQGLFGFVPIRRLNPAFSVGLEKLIEKAVEMYPEKRFQTIQEMRQAHQAVKEGKDLPGTAQAGDGAAPVESSAPMPLPEAQVTREMASPLGDATGRSSMRAQRIVTVCAAAVLILLGILLGLRLSETTWKSAARHASPSPSGTTVAIVSPSPGTPFVKVPGTPLPSVSPGKKAAVKSPSPKPSVTARKTVKPKFTPPQPVQSRKPPPLPGAEHPQGQQRPPSPERGNPPPPGGEWFIRQKEGFQVYLPGGYQKVSRDNSYLFIFQKIDNDEGPASLRYLQVKVAPSHGAPADLARKYMEKLQDSGCRILASNPLEKNKVLELSYTKPGYAGDASVREYLIRGNDGRRLYLLAASASPGNFSRYEREFSTFFNSFSQTGTAGLQDVPPDAGNPPSGSDTRPGNGRKPPERRPGPFRRNPGNR